MLDYYYWLTGLVIVLGGGSVYMRTRDPLHPAVFLAPLLFVGYCGWPLLLNRDGGIPALLGPESSEFVAQIYLLSTMSLYAGLALQSSHPACRAGVRWSIQSLLDKDNAAFQRKRIFVLSIILGAIASLAYWYAVYVSGGFSLVYSGYKGQYSSGVNYINEAPLLAYPAAILYALANSGRRVRATDLVFVLLLLSPNILHALFGVRRGPLFISLVVMFLSVIIIRGHIPKLGRVMVGVVLVLSAVVVLWTVRKDAFTEEGASISQQSLAARLMPSTERLWENDYIAGVSAVIVAREVGEYFWGYRYIVELLVRPIPREIWPTKYEDVGAIWNLGAEGGYTQFDQIVVLGFELPAGSALGLFADLYLELSWAGAAIAFAFGCFLRWLWVKHRTRGQFWSLLLLLALGLGIYLPTQSFSAWFHRFLFMAGFSILLWKLFVVVRKPKTAMSIAAR